MPVAISLKKIQQRQTGRQKTGQKFKSSLCLHSAPISLFDGLIKCPNGLKWMTLTTISAPVLEESLQAEGERTKSAAMGSPEMISTTDGWLRLAGDGLLVVVSWRGEADTEPEPTLLRLLWLPGDSCCCCCCWACLGDCCNCCFWWWRWLLLLLLLLLKLAAMDGSSGLAPRATTKSTTPRARCRMLMAAWCEMAASRTCPSMARIWSPSASLPSLRKWQSNKKKTERGLFSACNHYCFSAHKEKQRIKKKGDEDFTSKHKPKAPPIVTYAVEID